jgi:CheY-like chemotaxis protein
VDSPLAAASSSSESPQYSLVEAMEASEKIHPLPKLVMPSSIEDAPVSILVAEDNTVNQRILELMLAKLGYKCHLAANGLEVLKRVSEQSYDLILMDIEMPELPGLEAAKNIRALGIKTPIIAVSAHVFSEAKKSALEAGMDQFINKPINIESLRKVLERWLPK